MNELFSTDDERFLKRQMTAWLWTLSFPAYCALVRLLLVRCGYSTVRAMHDENADEGGFDLLALCHTDLSTFVTAVSIKTGRVQISRRNADELRGSMNRVCAEHGIIFATGSFSHRTRKVAGTSYLSSLRLIDGNELSGLLIEHRIGIRRHPTEKGEWQFDPHFFERLEQKSKHQKSPGLRL